MPGVWVFFVLSGYLMGKGFYSGRYGVCRRKIRDFYDSRFKRIAPTYYSVLILVGVLTVPGVYKLEHLWELLALAVFSQQNGASMPIVGALWSVQTEVAFYVLVPLLFCIISAAVQRANPVILILAVLGTGFVYRGASIILATQSGWVDRALVPLVANIDLFIAGMLINWVIPRIPKPAIKVSRLGYGLLILFFCYFGFTLVYAHVAAPNPDTQTYMNLTMYFGPTVVAIVTSIVILIFECDTSADREPNAVSKLTLTLTQYVGTISYAIYAWHESIFLHVRSSLPIDIGFHEALTSFLVAVCVTFFIAAASYNFVEERFTKRKVEPVKG